MTERTIENSNGIRQRTTSFYPFPELSFVTTSNRPAERFSLACLGFSFLFRGVQRGYFSFQSERSEIMKVDEWLISAKELPWQKMISLCRSRLDE